MIGELEPDQGGVERSPNLRAAHVAQQTFAHTLPTLNKTHIEFVLWRYRGGVDMRLFKRILTLSLAFDLINGTDLS